MNEGMDSPPQRRTPLAVPALLVILAMFHAGVNLRWERLDRQLKPPAEMAYAAKVDAYAEAYKTTGPNHPVEWAMAVVGISSMVPPAAPIVTGALTSRTGSATEAASIVNSVGLAFVLWGVYLFARRFLGPWESLLAAALVSAMPLVSSASRHAAPDIWAAAGVVWSLAALLDARGFRETPGSVSFGLVFGASLLAHWLTGVYLAFPILAAFLAGLSEAPDASPGRNQSTTAGPAINVITSLMIAASIAGSWYILQLGALRGVLPGITTMFTLPASVPVGALMADALLTMVNTTFLPFCLAGLTGACFLLLHPKRRPGMGLTLVALSGGLLILVTFWPLFPPAALTSFQTLLGLCIAAGLAAIPGRWARGTSIVLMGGFAVLAHANLAIANLGPWATLKLPAGSHWPAMTLYSSQVAAGSWIAHSPDREDWLNESLTLMEKTERERGYITTSQASYAIADIRPSNKPRFQRGSSATGVSSIAIDIRTDARPIDIVRPGIAGIRIVGKDQPDPGATPASGFLLAPLQLRTPCEVTADFTEPAVFDAIMLDTPPTNPDLVDYDLQYTDAMTGERREFSPPAKSRNPAGRRHWHHFEEVTASALVLLANRATRDANPLVIRRLEFYRLTGSPRPLIQRGSTSSLASLQDMLDSLDYAVVRRHEAMTPGSLPPEPFTACFDMIGESVPIRMPWGREYAAIYARRQEPLISFLNTPGFTLDVSDDSYPLGSAVIPWWPHDSEMVDPQGFRHWACRTPAIAEISLREPRAITGVAIAPYSVEQGFGGITVQYWDMAQGAWRELEPGRVKFERPRMALIPGEVRRAPEPWQTPITTDRMRFTILSGRMDQSGVETAHVGYFSVFGRPVEGSAPAGTQLHEGDALFTAQPLPGVDIAASTSMSQTPTEIAWVTPPLPANEPALLAFTLRATGAGTLAFSLNGEDLLIARNAPACATIYAGGGAVLAMRPEGYGDGWLTACRLRLPASKLPAGGPASLRCRLISSDSGAGVSLDHPGL